MKKGGKKTHSIIFFLIFGGMLLWGVGSGEGVEAWQAEVGQYAACSQNWVDPLSHWTNYNRLLNHKRCLDNKNNY